MEESKVSKLTSDDSIDLKEDVMAVTEGSDELGDETSSFHRGLKSTMSLERNFKHIQPISSMHRTESVASTISKSGKSTGFFGNFFNKTAKRDKYKDDILNLQKEIAYLQTKLKNNEEELNHLQNENTSLKKTITSLKHDFTELEQENERVKKTNEELKAFGAKIKSTVIEMHKIYEKKIARFDFENYVEVTKAESVQIGSGNIQNISNLDLDGLDRLLAQYHEKLETVAQELKQTDHNFQLTKNTMELLHQKVTALEDIVKEMTESLNDIRLSNQEITTGLEYTISLTDPRLIAKCVDELQQLPDTDVHYKFKDLKGNAKAGVLRVYKKYVKRLSLKRFVQRLEMEEIVGEDMGDHTPLQTDDCASLLVKWVNIKKENDVDTLLELFPRIKPGYDVRHGKTHSCFSSDSLTSVEDYRTGYLKEGLIAEIKRTFQDEITVQILPQFEEINRKLNDKRQMPKLV